LSRQVPWPRILAEGVAIVVSILLAFGIQAWWDGRQLAEERAQHLSLLQAQMSENRALLEVSDSLSRNAVDGLSELLSIMSPDLTSLPRPNWGELMAPGLGMDDRDLELSATESLLASGYLDLERDATLHRMLLAFRAQAGRHSRDLSRFVDVRTRVRDRLYTLGAVPGGAFSVAPGTVLSDVQLYGLFDELHARHRARVFRSTALIDLVDSIVAEIPSAIGR